MGLTPTSSRGGGGGSLSVTDESTTVNPTTEIEFTSGATVTDGGGGVAEVAVGGSVPGALIVRAFPFAFDTPDLVTGAAIYTPTVNDILYDVWIECATAWDQFAESDIYFDLSKPGIWLDDGHLDMTDNPDSSSFFGNILCGTDIGLLSALPYTATGLLGSSVKRFFPAKFINTNPVNLVISSDGTPSGDDPGATVGNGTVYLVTSTPAS